MDELVRSVTRNGRNPTAAGHAELSSYKKRRFGSPEHGS